MKPEFFRPSRTLKWRYKLGLLLIVFLFFAALSPLLKSFLASFVVGTDQPERNVPLVVESWDGNIEMFEASARMADSLRSPAIWAIVHNNFLTGRRRSAVMLNAWAGGIDTSRFKLIAVAPTDPKTLNAAKAVIDTAVAEHWGSFNLLTAIFHTARSRDVYQSVKPDSMHIAVIGFPYLGIDESNWSQSDQGLAFVFSEFVKRVYYRLFVL